jgi:MFS family permease
MRPTLDLLRREARARVFFAVLTQSALGTGAAYVALLLVAYQRFHSPWAISLVLLADLVPPMVLGPIFGAAADRWSRRSCVIAADLVRVGAFAGVAFVDGFAATMALSLVAGVGTAMFTPASLAALPSLVHRDRLPAATSLYGAIIDFGLSGGPALGALVLLFAGPETILVANAVTFALSAGLLARVQFGDAPPRQAMGPARRASLLAEAKEGLGAIRGIPGLWAVLGASAAALFFGGLVNVAELPFVTNDLHAREAIYSMVVALAGLGVVIGSLTGSRGGAPDVLRRRYLEGLFLMGLGFFFSGLAPSVPVILLTFLLAGFGNGLMLVHERLIVQATVPDRLAGRVFGVKDALSAWAFGTAFVAAGVLLSVADARSVIVIAGAGVALVAVLATLARGARRLAASGAPVDLAGDAGTDRGRSRNPRQHGADLVGGRDHWLAVLDDLGEGDDDVGIELRPGVHE